MCGWGPPRWTTQVMVVLPLHFTPIETELHGEEVDSLRALGGYRE